MNKFLTVPTLTCRIPTLQSLKRYYFKKQLHNNDYLNKHSHNNDYFRQIFT